MVQIVVPKRTLPGVCFSILASGQDGERYGSCKGAGCCVAWDAGNTSERPRQRVVPAKADKSPASIAGTAARRITYQLGNGRRAIRSRNQHRNAVRMLSIRALQIASGADVEGGGVAHQAARPSQNAHGIPYARSNSTAFSREGSFFPAASSLANEGLTFTREDNSFAKVGTVVGGVNLRFMAINSHIAKIGARGYFRY